MKKETKYKISKRYVRGDYENRRFVEVVKLVGSKDIHSFLWDMAYIIILLLEINKYLSRIEKERFS